MHFVARFLRWFGFLALTIFALLLVTFTLTRLSPVDPVLAVVGDHASRSSYEQARRELGLDRSLPEQFLVYVSRVAQGDLGRSSSTGQPVRSDLARTVPATVELATLAILLGAVVGVSLGVASGLRPGSWIDGIARFISLFGYSVPIFWLGLLMLLLFYAALHWAPGPGRLDIAFQYTVAPLTGFVLIDTWLSGQDGAFLDALHHLALPVTLLAFHALAGIARLTRTAILNEVGQEYTVAARAKGASDWRVVFSHVLPNVAGTILTVIALAYVSLLEGAVLTETVFAWPGLGRYLTTAMFAGDVPAILGGTLVIGLCFITINSITDLLVARLDPRIKP
ncbi:ABC transporter permease [Microvirga alba]|uniref:ABC transporter permease n=1 Tax=Microvirga alba TaxID=2791025 RepID=A0A931BRJ7_9HYPH|nr:ABC transporter permease [Microvirga alba]MBF9233925.1 ABC transporter permease [Microvirga alba]